MQLKEMANMVQKMIQENFISVALGEENERETDTYRYGVEREESDDTFYETGLEERLLPLLIGMLRLGKIRQALQTYRERTQKALKRSFTKVSESARVVRSLMFSLPSRLWKAHWRHRPKAA